MPRCTARCVDERVAIGRHRRVEHRKLAQRVDDCTRDEGQRREPCRTARGVDARVIGRDVRQRMRGIALRCKEGDRGPFANIVERDDFVAATGPHRLPRARRRGSRPPAPRRAGSSRRCCVRPRPVGTAGERDRRWLHEGFGRATTVVRCRARGARARPHGLPPYAVHCIPVHDVPPKEALDDFRVALVSRYCDDREIALRQQNHAFFQISGAGHEALLLGLARYLRPAYDWFFPYYRDRALALALGVTPYEMLLQAVGSADDPASGGRQMPCHWGASRLNIVSQTSCTGSQCLPTVGSAEAARYIGRRPQLEGCEAHGDELTYVSLGEGATSEGEFWESLNTACRLHLPVLYVVADNGYAISVRSSDQAPAPISEMVRGIRGLHVVKMDGRDYFEVRRKGANAIAHVRAGAGPCLVHAPRDAAVLALALRRPEEVPRPGRARGRTGARPHRRAPAAADRPGSADGGRSRRHARGGPRDRARRRRRSARRAPAHRGERPAGGHRSPAGRRRPRPTAGRRGASR